MEPINEVEAVATITLKGIPDDLYERIKQRAALNRRSINSEILVCLEHSVKAKPVDPDSFLARVDALRERVALPPLTEDFLRTAKAAGRR